MTSHRPKNLNLFTIHFPIPAIVSILHRITGVILFICIPFLLWLLEYSLTSNGFSVMQDWMRLPIIKFMTWLILMPLCFHFVAGIRHLLMDLHIGESLQIGRLFAWLTFVITFALIILLGIWLW